MKIQNLKRMGVINITPDSFSDGSLYNTQEKLNDRFNELKSWCDIVDIGACSTNPKAKFVSSEEELKRFENLLFPILDKVSLSKIVSIDTFRPEVFKKVSQMIWKYYPETQIYFNDVSGMIDDELLKLASEYQGKKWGLIFCHSNVSSREESCSHMNFCQDVAIYSQVNQHFKKVAELISHIPKVVLDPCFGFAKTKEQNLELLNLLPKLREEFSKYSMVMGISRKSFLRFTGESSSDQSLWPKFSALEALYLERVLRNDTCETDLILRTHDQVSTLAVQQFHKLTS